MSRTDPFKDIVRAEFLSRCKGNAFFRLTLVDSEARVTLSGSWNDAPLGAVNLPENALCSDMVLVIHEKRLNSENILYPFCTRTLLLGLLTTSATF